MSIGTAQLLSAEEAEGLSIHDIVMPLPGYDVIYPSHHGKISMGTRTAMFRTNCCTRIVSDILTIPSISGNDCDDSVLHFDEKEVDPKYCTIQVYANHCLVTFRQK